MFQIDFVTSTRHTNKHTENNKLATVKKTMHVNVNTPKLNVSVMINKVKNYLVQYAFHVKDVKVNKIKCT